MTLREEVLEQLIETTKLAEANGIDGVIAARRAFPGTPDSVLYEAWAELDGRRVDEWWKSIEKTIDGEIIRHALLKKEGGS